MAEGRVRSCSTEKLTLLLPGALAAIDPLRAFKCGSPLPKSRLHPAYGSAQTSIFSAVLHSCFAGLRSER
jgi:hypothetical protein